MRGDLIETFKIINGISNYARYFFNLSHRFQKLSLLTNWIFFFCKLSNIFSNKVPNQIKNNNSVENFKIKLDNFRKNSKKKKQGHFWEFSDALLNIL